MLMIIQKVIQIATYSRKKNYLPKQEDALSRFDDSLGIVIVTLDILVTMHVFAS